MKKTIAAISLWILVAATTSHASIGSDISVEKKVTRSDLIVVARADGKMPTDGEAINVREVERMTVLATIKGTQSLSTLSFVTRGFSDEFNPDCCESGKIYLLFLSSGYMEFDDKDGSVALIFREPERFVSPSAGWFSAYEIADGVVQGWKGRNCHLENVLEEIACGQSASVNCQLN